MVRKYPSLIFVIQFFPFLPKILGFAATEITEFTQLKRITYLKLRSVKSRFDFIKNVVQTYTPI